MNEAASAANEALRITATLEAITNTYLGRKGKLAELSRQMGSLDNDTRPKAGAPAE